MSTERAGYFDLGPVDLGENARRDMVLTLEDMGYEIEASHHEVAPAQHEIDFKYDEALKTADNIMTFKLAVKTIEMCIRDRCRRSQFAVCFWMGAVPPPNLLQRCGCNNYR